MRWENGEWLLLTDCQVMFTLGKESGVFLIPQRDFIGGTGVKAGKWHITSSSADVGLWFISSCCIWEQAFNLSLDGGVGNMPVHHRTINGWKKWENNSRKGCFFYWSGYVSRVDLNSDEYFLTGYCEPFIGFAVKLKELCDHTESVFCSRLESWQRIR